MYGTLAEAETYFTDELSGTWGDYTDGQKTVALEEATRQIDRLQFKGEKYQWSPTQTLAFPRVFNFNCQTIYFDEDLTNGGVVVPTDVEHATYLQAKHLLDVAIGGDSTGQALRAGITSRSILSTSESYDKTLSPVDLKTGIHRDAMQLLEKYLLVGW